MKENIESIGDLLVETIELRETLLLKAFVCREGPERPAVSGA
jgi:hypothetical protein